MSRIYRQVLVALSWAVGCAQPHLGPVTLAAAASQQLAPVSDERSLPLVVAATATGAAFQLGHRVLLHDGATLSIVEAGTNAPVVTRTFAHPLGMMASQPGESPVHGGLIVWSGADGATVAVDAATLRDVWSFPRTGVREYNLEYAAADGVVITSYSLRGDNEHNDVVAIDAATGRELWHRTMDGLYHLWAGGSNAYFDVALTNHVHGLLALDASTGKEVFRREKLGLNHLRATASRIAVTYGDGTVRVLDSKTGADVGVASIGTPRWGSELVIDANVAYFYASDTSSGTAAALDLTTGKLLWRSQPHAVIVLQSGIPNSTGGLAVTSRGVVFCSDDGVVHGLDKKSGAEQWSYGIGHCNPIAIAESTTRAAAYINGDHLDVLTPGTPVLEAATISGTVTLYGDVTHPVQGATVMALGVSTTTDAKGHYQLSVRGQGKLVVRARADVEGDEKCGPTATGEATAIALTGKRSYEADLGIAPACSCGL